MWNVYFHKNRDDEIDFNIFFLISQEKHVINKFTHLLLNI